MKTHIIFRCANFKRHPLFKDALVEGGGYSKEVEKTILIEEDWSAFRNGSYVLSPAAKLVMAELEEQFDNVIPQEINGETYHMPEILFGRGYKPQTLDQIRTACLSQD